MTAAGHWRPWLSAFTLQTLIGLLTVTGIRIGEAIRLDRDDLALEHGRLVIRNSKFGKSRQLPLHQTTTRALHAYLRQRDELCPHVDTHALLITATGKRLDRSNVERQFRQLRTHGVDVFGSVLVTLALMLGVYAIVKSTDYDRASLHTFGFGGAAVALLGVFLAYGSRIANPVFPLPILRVPGLVGTQHRARVPGHRGCSRRSCSACCSAARARLRRAGDGPRVPADDADDGRAVARRRGAARLVGPLVMRLAGLRTSPAQEDVDVLTVHGEVDVANPWEGSQEHL
jgi:Phage integrase family